ncbi:MAG: diaminopimelate decarboxylase [Clostridia bacterium]|nr:diaminopimelate decarboxylase [Clostridia bacterium]
MNLRDTLKINSAGVLEIGGAAATELVKSFGTPLYVLDEDYIRKVCRAFVKTMNEEYGDGNVCFASKALSCMAMYKLIGDEGLKADVVSGGEMYTALRAGFKGADMYFHGNNKLPKEIELAVSNGVRIIVVDNLMELPIIDSIAKKYSVLQKVLVRVNPGVEAHTHHFVQTARADSKFGCSIALGEADIVIDAVKEYSNLDYHGLHCHIGSQIFDKTAYIIAIDKMTSFIKALEDRGIITNELNLGGGFGIYYTEEDPKYTVDDYSEYVATVARGVKSMIETKQIRKPVLTIEPGRAIVGEAGITLYSAGMIRDIKDIKKYVAIDGGMFDNPRYALYNSKYSAVIANRANAPADEIVTIAGKCCESGDIISKNVKLAKVEEGDIIAVFSTGAYNYSMSSNYNRNLVPPVVLVKDGKADYIVRPQSYEDLVRHDVIPARLK